MLALMPLFIRLAGRQQCWMHAYRPRWADPAPGPDVERRAAA
jgi:hypothetical protein